VKKFDKNCEKSEPKNGILAVKARQHSICNRRRLNMDDSYNLLLLEEIIKEVYLPMLQQTSGQSKVTDSLRNEFIGSEFVFILFVRMRRSSKL
jgi:hypothetical protein